MGRFLRLTGLTGLTGLFALELLLLTVPALAGTPFEDGEVFAGLPGGEIARFDAKGRQRPSLWAPSGGQMTGMCFDAEDRLYATDFYSRVVVRYSAQGDVLDARWAEGFGGNPESCVVSAEGHVFVGTVEPERGVYEFDASGSLLRIHHPRPAGSRGMDWIDLAADQCTLFYTSEGSSVGRFDVCKGSQLSDLASLSGTCFALRVRSEDEVMVACGEIVYRLSTGGQILQRYEMPGEKLFGLNLDRDGRHFWTGGIGSANVYRVDIDSGDGAGKVRFNAAGVEPKKERDESPPENFLDFLGKAAEALSEAFEVFTGGERMGGLAVYGERVAAMQAVARTPEAAVSPAALSPPPGPATTKPGDGAQVAEEAPSESASQQAEPSPPPPQQQPPAPVHPPDGVLALGRAEKSVFAAIGSQAETESTLRLDGLEVRGRGAVQLSTDLDLDRVTLEVRDGETWRSLGPQPLEVAVSEDRPAEWPLRVRTGECPEAAGADQTFAVFAEAIELGGAAGRLALPLELEVVADPWLHCWWPVLAMFGGVVLTGIGIHGFLSPSRFAARASLVLSPEEDLSEGFSHPLRAQKGSGSGFYRDARLYLFEDFRFATRPGGAWLRLRAEGQRLRLKPVGGTVWRRAADGEWELLDEGESTLRPGVEHRNELSTIFFEYRQT